MARIAFYEDDWTGLQMPLALLRPVFELRCGHFTLRERWQQSGRLQDWGALVRPYLAASYQVRQPQAKVNDLAWLREAPVTLVNGRWLSDPLMSFELEGSAAWLDETLVGVTLTPDETAGLRLEEAARQIETIAKSKSPIEAKGKLLKYPWDLVHQNPEQLERDYVARLEHQRTQPQRAHEGLVGPAERLYIDPSAIIDPYVVFDTTAGPIWIDAHARVQAFTRIEGPAYVGSHAQLFRTNLRAGSSIGPVCRVGGEVEESIIHGYSNKYHDGFLGHAYVGSWVNLGALTTNSDLKNDYSEVSVPLSGTGIRSGSTKVGCFIGDHTKTALSSLMNTGTSVGAMCLILPGGELLPKHIPTGCRIWHGRLEMLPDGVENVIATARYAMSRRNCELTAVEEDLLRTVFQQTEEERRRALQRASHV